MLESVITGTVPDLAIGAKTPPNAFPFCLIVPGTDSITPDSNRSDQHMMDYLILVAIENDDVEAGVQSVIDIGGDIYDAICADYTLGGVVDEIYPVSFDPRFGEGATYTRHWVMLRFTCRKQIER